MYAGRATVEVNDTRIYLKNKIYILFHRNPYFSTFFPALLNFKAVNIHVTCFLQATSCRTQLRANDNKTPRRF